MATSDDETDLLTLLDEELTTLRGELLRLQESLTVSFGDRLNCVHQIAMHRKRLRDANYNPITGTTPLGAAETVPVQDLISRLNQTTIYLRALDVDRAEMGADWQRISFEVGYVLKDIKEEEERIERVSRMTEEELAEEARKAKEEADEHEEIMRKVAESNAQCVDPGEFDLWDLWSTDDEEEGVEEEDKSSTETAIKTPNEATTESSTGTSAQTV